MPDVREVFEMVKQQVEPDKDSWAEQERRIRSSQRKKKTAVFALVAAIAVLVAVLFAVDASDSGSNTVPASQAPSAGPAAIGAEYASVDVATGELTGLGIVPERSAVDASPDGSKITYIARSAGTFGVVAVANADGSDARIYSTTQAPGAPAAPRWSPDGSKIVYQGVAPYDRTGNLFILDVATGDVEQLTHLKQVDSSRYDGLYYMAPTFSADGTSVLFDMPTVVASGGAKTKLGWDVWSIPVSGGEPSLVLRNAFLPDVEPGGGRVAYIEVHAVEGRAEFGSLSIANGDGSGARKLVGGNMMAPRWSPDGSGIAYSDDGRDGLYVVDIASGETRLILEPAEWPEWVDEDTMIVDMSD